MSETPAEKIERRIRERNWAGLRSAIRDAWSDLNRRSPNRRPDIFTCEDEEGASFSPLLEAVHAGDTVASAAMADLYLLMMTNGYVCAALGDLDTF